MGKRSSFPYNFFFISERNISRQEGISFECQPPAFRQSVHNSEQVWTFQGGGGGAVQWGPRGPSWRSWNISTGDGGSCTKGAGTRRGPSTKRGPGPCTQSPPPKKNDRHDWKHYLTLLAGGNKGDKKHAWDVVTNPVFLIGGSTGPVGRDARLFWLIYSKIGNSVTGSRWRSDTHLIVFPTVMNMFSKPYMSCWDLLYLN